MDNFKKIKCVLFDLDGTLVSNYAAIHSCLAETFGILGLPKPSYDSVVKAVGGSILLTIKRLIGEARAEEAGHIYVKLFPKHVLNGLSEIPFALAILRALAARGFKLGCLTNKGQDGAETILTHLGMDKYLNGIFGTTLLSTRKPELSFTLEALQKLGASPEESAIVGDSMYDALTGKNAGMPAFLVATGADSAADLQKNCPWAMGVYSDMRALAKGVWGFDI